MGGSGLGPPNITILKMAATLSAAPGSNLLTILKMAATLSAAPGSNL